MSRGDYAPDQDGVVAEILRHLAEIGAGRTSITDDDCLISPVLEMSFVMQAQACLDLACPAARSCLVPIVK